MVAIIISHISTRFRIIKRFFKTSFHLILTTTLYGKYYYSHFTDEDTEVQGLWGNGRSPVIFSLPAQCLSQTLSYMPSSQGSEKNPLGRTGRGTGEEVTPSPL